MGSCNCEGTMFLQGVIFLFGLTTISAQYETHTWWDRSGIVHLFEWKWNDIADECERFLAPKGYGGVQLSPVSENTIIRDPRRPWWERYQPLSYKLVTRSGDEQELSDMIRRCNKVGVRIYVDVIFNHMAAWSGNGGTAGSTANIGDRDFPAVPYSIHDFNPSCSITNYDDPINVRNCELNGMPDINQGKEWPRNRILDFLNKLIDMGVAGFRVDACKHMWPGDLKLIFDQLHNLNTSHGFPQNQRPFITQEVIDLGHEKIKASEYVHLGTVTEFKHSAEIGRVFRGKTYFRYLWNWGSGWGFLDNPLAFIFVDNHDNQRGHGAGGADVLTHKDSYRYKMATAFMLAHPYGHRSVRIMSSFAFDHSDQGPPQDENENLISPSINPDGSCGNGLICEHRWRQIYNMIEFRNTVFGTSVNDFWSNDYFQMLFCRGDKGFILFNLEDFDVDRTFQTCLPAGKYCDIISGEKNGNNCTGLSVDVELFGWAKIRFPKTAPDGVLAIHINSKLA